MNATVHDILPGELRVPVVFFRDARDVIPRAAHVRYDHLAARLAPDRPRAYPDVAARVDRGRTTIDRIAATVLAGGRQRTSDPIAWVRTLETAAYKASAGPSDAVSLAVAAAAADLKERVTRQAKLQLPCWSPTIYTPGAVRGATGVQSVTALVLDFDDGTAIDEATHPWMDWPFILHTTWSHREDSPRFRLVLVLADPVPAAAWPRAWNWAAERAGRKADAKCKDPSRLYLGPAVASERAPWRAVVHDPGGHLLRIDWERFAEAPPARRHGSPPRTGAPPADPRRRAARELLHHDRNARLRAAELLDATIVDRRADRIRCPSCGRDSVWFWLEPGAQSTASCKHRESCHWWGHLDDLLDAVGGAHVQ
jgi:hypothetical protein